MPVWDSTFQLVLLGALLIGCTSGVLGTFAVLRKRSLLGDALAHAALPGVALAFMLTQSKALPVLLTGASLSGVIGVLLIQVIVTYTRIKADAALGIVLSVFFGGGIVLLTHIQQSAVGNQSGLDKFLFGQAASIVASDLYAMSVMVVVVLVLVGLFFKEFSALIFDPGFLASIGFAPRLVDLLLMSLIVLTVMVGLQAVGVILVAAMLITPAVSARFWTNDLLRMVLISAFIGGLSGAAGAWISALAPRIPTGPVMVLVATGVFVVSAFVAPSRGLIARWRRLRGNHWRENTQHFLRACVELQEQADTDLSVIALTDLAQVMHEPLYRVRRLAKHLAKNGKIESTDEGAKLTTKGYDDAVFVLKSHRLWEYYLVYRSILEEDHVDRSADEVEHILTPQIIERLEAILVEENIDVENVTSIHATDSGFRKAGQDA
ncbi:MAG: iron chelate uptake ABC transporter family permease subunit [Candidatus Latescibacteria bacterium]|jgi:manganese/zinc/iron transport system permease protein|nr:iron chelate uptake ABC transporter family permease subunit [Candidatus Latescibacterota bacterium]